MANVTYQVWVGETCWYDLDNIGAALSKAKKIVNDRDSYFYGCEAKILMVIEIERVVKIEKGIKKREGAL